MESKDGEGQTFGPEKNRPCKGFEGAISVPI